MSDDVLVLAETTIHDGQLDYLKALLSEMLDAIERDELGTLNFEWFIADDGKTVDVYERYADSEAYMAHLRNLDQKYAERMFACLTVTALTIYGNPSDEVRAVFAGQAIRMRYLSPFAGIAR